MWTGSWNAALTVYTGTYVFAAPIAGGFTTWTGTVAVGSDYGSYVWDGTWS